MAVLNLRGAACIFAIYGIVYSHLIKGDLMPSNICVGKHNMPISGTELKIKDRLFPPLRCKFCGLQSDTVTLENTGETIIIHFSFGEETTIPVIENGPLKDKGTYRFKHMYFNWLISMPDEWGFNNVQCPTEIHSVFYNTKYGDYEKALQQNEGIAVLSAGFRVRPLSNIRGCVKTIADSLQHIHNANTNVSLSKDKVFSLYDILPLDTNAYYTYTGTMVSEKFAATTCKTKVIWIEFEEMLKISPEQALEFSLLYTYYGVPLAMNTQNYEGPAGIIYNSLNPFMTSNHMDSNHGSLPQFTTFGVLLEVFALLFI